MLKFMRAVCSRHLYDLRKKEFFDSVGIHNLGKSTLEVMAFGAISC